MDTLVTALENLPSVTSAEREGRYFRLTCDQLYLVLPGLMSALKQSEQTMVDLVTREATLDDVFIQLTGKHLAEETRA